MLLHGGMKLAFVALFGLLALLTTSQASARHRGLVWPRPPSTAPSPPNLGPNPPLRRDLLIALNDPDAVTIYSLDPTVRPKTNEPTYKGESIVGSVDLDTVEAKIASHAVRDAISNFKEGYACLCWGPRHALRIKSNGHTFDIVASDMSVDLGVFKDGNAYPEVHAFGFQTVLDSLLKAHGISVVRGFN